MDATSNSPETSQSHHIVFDDWSLIEEDGSARVSWTEAEGIQLLTLFPTQTSVYVHYFVLVCVVKELPPEPWPITVAGLPLFITDDANEVPFDAGKPGWGERALQHLDAQTDSTEEIVKAIWEYFAQIPKLETVSAITCVAGILLVEYKQGEDLVTKDLPTTIAGLHIRYVRVEPGATIDKASRSRL